MKMKRIFKLFRKHLPGTGRSALHGCDMRPINVTPLFVDFLFLCGDKIFDDEVFVFGSRNSGRHCDEVSAFARERFGAVMGQREGLQGRSYAIPAIGDDIGLKEIRQSVAKFSRFAMEHPELQFLVTAIGYDDGDWSPSQIAPLFRKASRLPNVSLPQEFWDILRTSRSHALFRRIRPKMNAKTIVQRAWSAIFHKWMKLIPARTCYSYLTKRIEAEEGLSSYGSRLSKGIVWGPLRMPFYPKSAHNTYFILNHNTRHAYMILDDNKRIPIIRPKDIDWESVSGLPDKVKKRIKKRISSGLIFHTYQNGAAEIVWKVGPDRGHHYLDPYGGGPTTDGTALCGKIDTECRVVERLHVMPKRTEETFGELNKHRYGSFDKIAENRFNAEKENKHYFDDTDETDEI